MLRHAAPAPYPPPEGVTMQFLNYLFLVAVIAVILTPVVYWGPVLWKAAKEDRREKALNRFVETTASALSVIVHECDIEYNYSNMRRYLNEVARMCMYETIDDDDFLIAYKNNDHFSFVYLFAIRYAKGLLPNDDDRKSIEQFCYKTESNIRARYKRLFHESP